MDSSEAARRQPIAATTPSPFSQHTFASTSAHTLQSPLHPPPRQIVDMLPQRMAQQSLRRLAASRPAYQLITPSAIVSSNALVSQRRFAAAQTVGDKDARSQILDAQRLNRPVAPHLSIYRPQITWYLSISNRLTGIMMGGVLYLYPAAYLVAPALGWHLESAVLAASFAAWPLALKVATKFLLAFPFTLHTFLGIRHLIWDTASMISNKAVNQSGWTAIALGVTSALALAFM